MNKTYSLDGVQAILSYPFKAPGWQSKFVIGAVLFFANYIIPIVPGIFLTGYFAKMIQTAIVGEAEPALPEWDDWGDLFKRGLKVFCATLIYMLPALILIIGGYLLVYVPLILESVSSSSRYSSSMNGTSGIMIILSFVGLAMVFLGLILYLPLALMLPPALAHLIAKDSFAAAFRIREWGSILRANFWGFFTTLAVTTGVYMLLLTVVYALYFTVILCVLMPIGLSIIVVYLGAISAPMLGEAYRKGVDKLAASASV